MKTKTYILLALVLSIWGIISFKIVSVVNPSTPEVLQQHYNMAFKPKFNKTIDTFSIQTVNRDPFLGTLLIREKPKTKNLKTKMDLVWLPIVYHGIISKQNSKAKVFIVSINGQQYLVKSGQVISEITLIRGNSKSILVSYKGVRKTIQKT